MNSKYREGIREIRRLIEDWEKSEKYLTNPHDAEADRYAGQTYGSCARELKDILVKHFHSTPNQKTKKDNKGR